MKFRYARVGGKWHRFEAFSIEAALTHCAKKWPLELNEFHLQFQLEGKWWWAHHVHHA